MALHDNIFVAQSLSNVTNIFEAEIPEDKLCLQLKIQRKALDQPVFREPDTSSCGYGTATTKPLRVSTWLRYLQRLGLKAELELPSTQYCFRRGLINAINSMFVPKLITVAVTDFLEIRSLLPSEIKILTICRALSGITSIEKSVETHRPLSSAVLPTRLCSSLLGA